MTQVRHRSQGRANERPVHAVFADSQISRRQLLFFFGGAGIPPANGGVVVVGAGVDHGIGLVAVRQVHVRAAIAESELQDLHARDVQPLAQLVHFGSDVAKVFGDERQLAQRALASAWNKLGVRALSPSGH